MTVPVSEPNRESRSAAKGDMAVLDDGNRAVMAADMPIGALAPGKPSCGVRGRAVGTTSRARARAWDHGVEQVAPTPRADLYSRSDE